MMRQMAPNKKKSDITISIFIYCIFSEYEDFWKKKDYEETIKSIAKFTLQEKQGQRSIIQQF